MEELIIKELKTKIIKLDSLDITNFNKKIGGIKIDTEGEDFKVLKGSELIIKKHKPEIIIEVREENKMQIQQFLNINGYTIFDAGYLNKNIDLNKTFIDGVLNVYAQPS